MTTIREYFRKDWGHRSFHDPNHLGDVLTYDEFMSSPYMDGNADKPVDDDYVEFMPDRLGNYAVNAPAGTGTYRVTITELETNNPIYTSELAVAKTQVAGLIRAIDGILDLMEVDDD